MSPRPAARTKASVLEQVAHEGERRRGVRQRRRQVATGLSAVIVAGLLTGVAVSRASAPTAELDVAGGISTTTSSVVAAPLTTELEPALSSDDSSDVESPEPAVDVPLTDDQATPGGELGGGGSGGVAASPTAPLDPPATPPPVSTSCPTISVESEAFSPVVQVPIPPTCGQQVLGRPAFLASVYLTTPPDRPMTMNWVTCVDIPTAVGWDCLRLAPVYPNALGPGVSVEIEAVVGFRDASDVRGALVWASVPIDLSFV